MVTAGELVALIRALTATPDQASARQFVETEPRVRQPQVVALLDKRSRRAARLGNQQLHRQLQERIEVLVGPTDPAVIEAVVTIGRAGLRAPTEQAAIDELQAAVTTITAEPAWTVEGGSPWPELWNTVATVSDSLAANGAGDYWFRSSVIASRLAVEETRATDPDMAYRLDALSRRLARLAARTGGRAAMVAALSVARRAVIITPETSHQLPFRLARLADRLGDLAATDHDRVRLDEAVAARRLAVEHCAEGTPELPLLLDRLAVDLGAAVSAGGSPGLLDEAITASRRALALTGGTDEDLTRRRYALSARLGTRYTLTGDQNALSESVDLARQSVGRDTSGGSENQAHLANLATRLADLVLLDGDAQTTAELHAMASMTLATPAGESADGPDEIAQRLGELAERLVAVAERTANPTTVDLAIAVGKAAIAATPVQSQALGHRLAGVGAQVAKLSSLRSEPGRPRTGPPGSAPAKARSSRAHGRLPDQAHGRAPIVVPNPTGEVPVTPPLQLETAPTSPSPLVAREDTNRADSPAKVDPPQIVPVEDRSSYSNGPVLMLQIHIWLLFLIPTGLRLGILGALGNPATVWGLGLFFLWLVAELTPGNDAGRPCPPLRIALGAFWIINMISFGLLHQTAVPSDEASNADRYIIGLFAFTGVALVAGEGLRTRAQQRRVLRTLASAVAVMCLIAIAQSRLNIDYTQFAARIPGLTAWDLTSVFNRSGLNRPAGTATHPIEFGVVVGAALALAIHLLIYERSWPRSRRWAMFGLIALGVPIAVSRSALLVAVIVIVFFFIEAERRIRIKGSIVTFGLMAVVFMSVPGLLGTLIDYVTVGSADSSISTRTSDYAAVAHYLRDAPLLGRGPGTFLPRLRILDNQYLLTLIETGLFGMIALIGVLSVPAWLGSASRTQFTDRQDRQLSRMYTAIGIGFLASAATFDALSFPMFTAFIALTVGMASSHWSRSRDVSSQGQP